MREYTIRTAYSVFHRGGILQVAVDEAHTWAGEFTETGIGVVAEQHKVRVTMVKQVLGGHTANLTSGGKNRIC